MNDENGAWDFLGADTKLESIQVNGVLYRLGASVRIRPQRQTDIMDIALTDKTAVIEAIEQDIEDRILFALVLDDDPGKDLGMLRQPGHRFFFAPHDVELLSAAE